MENWKVLDSCALGMKFDSCDTDRELYLDATGRGLLCTHGYTASQILNWKAGWKKEDWVQCDCVNAAGMFTKLNVDTMRTAIQNVPIYADILKRQKPIERLGHKNILACQAPGKSSGEQIYISLKDGTPRCKHGNSVSFLERQAQRQKAGRKNSKWACGCPSRGMRRDVFQTRARQNKCKRVEALLLK